MDVKLGPASPRTRSDWWETGGLKPLPSSPILVKNYPRPIRRTAGRYQWHLELACPNAEARWPRNCTWALVPSDGNYACNGSSNSIVPG